MSYSDFTVKKVTQTFGLNLIEGGRFMPDIDPVEPSRSLADFLAEGIPLALETGSEKARSELIISPVLVEVRKILNRKISLFSGEDFTVDAALGLSGTCDFLITRSPIQSYIEAPVLVIVEAKKADLKVGLGQCIAEMVAAQKLNAISDIVLPTIYGCVTSGTNWRFLKLVGVDISIDFTEYPLPPVENILGMLVWLVKN